ncbi:tyrosine-type recombinase/integrase [Halorhabdus amylolytica]|uniref:tyrosine-type recombinase/integrase n=1 Tax=Halorhabdus amylolytica TaxID=2559573 RepID=UPI0010AAC92A|nr:site-specific integrase [Halorhabdus amylolytica]
MSTELDPLDPATARQMYLDERRNELAVATIQSHGYRLQQFVDWCNQDGIENLNELSGRDVHRFRVDRRNEDDLATATMKGQLATLRIFLRFCASVDGVEPGMDEKIILPRTTAEDARDELVNPDRARQILEHLDRYRYATLEHALLSVLWHTGLRIGAAISLDVEDYDSGEQYLDLVHRPADGTPLKNGAHSERFVALSERVCTVLDDWLEVNHPGVEDDYGRLPLFATRRARLSKNRGRTIAYQYTRPCVYSNECPHDRDEETCEALSTARAYACPSAMSPHPFRRGAITYHLQQDTPEKVVSDRMDVGMDVLERHYDQRSAKDKLRQRRRYLPDD